MLRTVAPTALAALAFSVPVLAQAQPSQNSNPKPQPSATASASSKASARASASRGGDLDDVYDNARNLIERGQFDRAIAQLQEIIGRFGSLPSAEAKDNRVDAAMYWKAYAEAKMRALPEALATVAEMQKTFADSRWIKDAMALALEVQQQSGQAVSPDAQPDEDLKLLALRGLMQSDPDRAVPMIEQILSGNNSMKVKENALFVLSQSRSTRARDILANVAKGGANPDLQLKAIRYLGSLNADSTALLEEIYRGSSDERVKRSILRTYMMKSDRARLAGIANDANSPAALRGDAIQYLGNLRADDELQRLYARDLTPELKRRVINGLFVSGNATALVAMARAEKDFNLKKEIVQKLGMMKSKEATDYMVELLK
jgi:hypothetical protein